MQSEGSYLLMMRICKDNKKKYKSIGITILPQFWNFTKNQPRGDCPNREAVLILINDKTNEFTSQIVEYKLTQKEFTATNTVEKVYNFSIFCNAKNDFGGQLFSSATLPISIIYYQKENISNNQNRIEYCAPRTYVRSNLIDGIVMDNTDIKYLPHSECKKSDLKIWKIAMSEGLLDFTLMQMLDAKYSSLRTFLRKVGFIEHV